MWRPTLGLPYLFIVSFLITKPSIAENNVKSHSLDALTEEKQRLETTSHSGGSAGEKFFPNITTSAKTAGPGNVIWHPTPFRIDVPDSYITNSLSVGIGKRMEIGITPFEYELYFVRNRHGFSYDVYQVLLKYSFLETDSFNLAIASSLKFVRKRPSYEFSNNSSSEPDSSKSESKDVIKKKNEERKARVKYAILANYRFDSGWILGTNLESRYVQSNNAMTNSFLSQDAVNRGLVHVRTDLMQPVTSWLRATYSVSREYLLRSEEEVPYTHKLTHGIGLGFTWVRPGRNFTSLGFGFHRFIESKSTSTIINASFD